MIIIQSHPQMGSIKIVIEYYWNVGFSHWQYSGEIDYH